MLKRHGVLSGCDGFDAPGRAEVFTHRQILPLPITRNLRA